MPFVPDINTSAMDATAARIKELSITSPKIKVHGKEFDLSKPEDRIKARVIYRSILSHVNDVEMALDMGLIKETA